MNDIEILEDFIKEVAPEYEKVRIGSEEYEYPLLPIKFKPTKEIANAIENLINRVKELEDENEELSIIKTAVQSLESCFASDNTYYVISKRGFLKGEYRHVLDDYIPKSKIKEKIEEVNNRENVSIVDIFESMKEYAIQVLQELLEE